VKLCTSSVRPRQLKERSRWRRAGQPESGGRRSILPMREISVCQLLMQQCMCLLLAAAAYRLSARLRYLR
jgi:hypothetical protein